MTAALAPSPHLVAWSRLGPGYETSDLDEALAARELWEDMDAIRPKRDLPLHLALMSRSPKHRQARDWLEANDLFRAEVLDTLADADEPLLSKQIDATPQVAWRSSGWNENRSVALMLQVLQSMGEVAIDGRAGNQRRWTIAERVYGEVPDTPAPDDARRELDVRRLRGLGIARSSGTMLPGEPIHVGQAGEPALVEGTGGEWRVDPVVLDRVGTVPGARLLSPFDAIVRDRVRMADLWDFDYALEMYKPAAKRRWGYFALPVLYADGWWGSSMRPRTAGQAGSSSTPCMRTGPGRGNAGTRSATRSKRWRCGWDCGPSGLRDPDGEGSADESAVENRHPAAEHGVHHPGGQRAPVPWVVARARLRGRRVDDHRGRWIHQGHMGGLAHGERAAVAA